MSMVPIGKILKTRVREIGFGRQADAFEILKFAAQYIAENFKGPIGEKLFPQSFKDGVLFIASKSAPAAAEIKIYEKELLEYVNRKTGRSQKAIKLRIIL